MLERLPVDVDELLHVLQFLDLYLFLTFVDRLEFVEELFEGLLLIYVLVVDFVDDGFDHTVALSLRLIDEMDKLILGCLDFLVERLHKCKIIFNGGSRALTHSIVLHFGNI